MYRICWHIGAGVEHTLSQVVGDADVGLIGEYYRYETVESGKLTDLLMLPTVLSRYDNGEKSLLAD